MKIQPIISFKANKNVNNSKQKYSENNINYSEPSNYSNLPSTNDYLINFKGGINNVTSNKTKSISKKAAMALAAALIAINPASKAFAQGGYYANQAMMDGQRAGQAQGQALVDQNNNLWNNLDEESRKIAYDIETLEAKYYIENSQTIPNNQLKNVIKAIGATEKDAELVSFVLNRYSPQQQIMGNPFLFKLSPERQAIWQSIDSKASTYTMQTGKLLNVNKNNLAKIMEMDNNKNPDDVYIYAIALMSTNKLLGFSLQFMSPNGVQSGDL